VGPFNEGRLGVVGLRPMLNRALAGAGIPGRKVWPGKGVLSVMLLKSNFLTIVEDGVNVKLSVFGAWEGLGTGIEE
jgi:hypothetical protein